MVLGKGSRTYCPVQGLGLNSRTKTEDRVQQEELAHFLQKSVVHLASYIETLLQICEHAGWQCI